MSILKVARIAHPVLRSPAKPVRKEAFRDPLFQKLIDDMRETMYEYEGVGLAAPQVHEGLRLAVIEVPGSDERARAEVPVHGPGEPRGHPARRRARERLGGLPLDPRPARGRAAPQAR